MMTETNGVLFITNQQTYITKNVRNCLAPGQVDGGIKGLVDLSYS